MLIDMMGLGKSIQLLSLVLSNPFTPSEAMDTTIEPEVEAGNGGAQAEHVSSEGELEAERADLFCYCGGREEGPMVRCVECNSTQHTACAGFDADLESDYRSELVSLSVYQLTF
jgi:hypothetical protein